MNRLGAELGASLHAVAAYVATRLADGRGGARRDSCGSRDVMVVVGGMRVKLSSLSTGVSKFI